MREISYDQKCDELARYFLSDIEHGLTEERVKELAQVIQQAIEEKLEDYGPADV
jgi:hypothetical protein